MSDPPVVFTVSFVILGVLAVLLCIVVVRFRRLSDHERYWTGALICAALSAVGYLVSGATGDVWWAVLLGNTTNVAAFGFAWLGCRSFNRRRGWPVAIVLAVLALATALAAVLSGSGGENWGGAVVKLTALAALSAGAGIESFRRPLRSLWPAVVFGVVMFAHALYAGAHAAAFFVLGRDSAAFVAVFGPTADVIFDDVIALVGTASAIGIIVLARRAEARERVRAASGRLVHTAAAFQSLVDADLAGGRPSGVDGEPYLVFARIRDAATLRAAVSTREYAAIVADLASAVSGEAPVDAVLGALPRGVTGVYLPHATATSAARYADAVRETVGARHRALDPVVELTVRPASTGVRAEDAVAEAVASLEARGNAPA